MMKGLAVMDENMSNLTSASSEISASPGTRMNDSSVSLYPHPQRSSTSTNQEPLPTKKRNLPGNPDPEAEVIALSPKTLLATNRFICEICNKGFQRDQNLQLHRRGHNLPWKLKQRSNKDVIRKKVYVCPETTCVHHEPSRALGDLTGIKKHFCRKHGEKKWKCDKCSKRYAVQSDWKAHSKICGTKEYKCDCGTLFSRRDSFITHRAFCDALAQESARAVTAVVNPLLHSHTHTHHHHHHQLQHHPLQPPPPPLLKKEQDFPPWLPEPHPHNISLDIDSDQSLSLIHQQLQNPNPPISSPYISATALLQKASQIGQIPQSPSPAVSGLGMPLPSRDHMPFPFPSFGNNKAAPSFTSHNNNNNNNNNNYLELELEHGAPNCNTKTPPSSSCLFHHPHVVMPNPSPSGFTFEEEVLTGMLNPISTTSRDATNNNHHFQFGKTNNNKTSGTAGGGGRASDEMTRDFLGLKAFSHTDFFTISGLHHLGSSTSSSHNQTPHWQG